MSKGKTPRFADHVHMGEKPKFKSFLLRIHQEAQLDEKNSIAENNELVEAFHQPRSPPRPMRSHPKKRIQNLFREEDKIEPDDDKNSSDMDYSPNCYTIDSLDHRVPPIKPTANYNQYDCDRLHQYPVQYADGSTHNSRFHQHQSPHQSYNLVNKQPSSSVFPRDTMSSKYDHLHEIPGNQPTDIIYGREPYISNQTEFNQPNPFHINNHPIEQIHSNTSFNLSTSNIRNPIPNVSPTSTNSPNSKLWQPFSEVNRYSNLVSKYSEDTLKATEVQDLRIPNNIRRHKLEELICDVSSFKQKPLPQLVPSRPSKMKYQNASSKPMHSKLLIAIHRSDLPYIKK